MFALPRASTLVSFLTLLWLGVFPGAVFAQTDSASGEARADEPGAILVMPGNDNPMPDISALVKLLSDEGYKAPGYQTEILDGRRLLKGLGDGVLLVTSSTTLTCSPEARDARGDYKASEPSTAIKEAERALLRTDYEVALEWLKTARILLPCMINQVEERQVYELNFLEGLSFFFQGQPEASEKAFERALAIDPGREWDKNYPPQAWTLFLQARENVAKLPKVTFRQRLSRGVEKVWVNGRQVTEEAVTYYVGEHLVQVEGVDDAGEPAHFAWLLTADPEYSKDPVWITDSRSLQSADAVFIRDSSSRLRTMLLDLMVRWARLSNRAWVLLVNPEFGAPPPRVLYLDARKGTVTTPPAWMVTSSRADRSISVPSPNGPRTVAIPEALYGWQLGGGLIVQQQLNGPARLSGLELAAHRRIVGSLEAKVSVDTGFVLSTGTGPQPFFQFFSGVRTNKTLDPFGVFAEGGLLVCDCAEKASIGLQARTGAYVLLNPVSLIELDVGAGVVPRDGITLGQFGLLYRRAF